jgi:hypothetical protein
VAQPQFTMTDIDWDVAATNTDIMIAGTKTAKTKFCILFLHVDYLLERRKAICMVAVAFQHRTC